MKKIRSMTMTAILVAAGTALYVTGCSKESGSREAVLTQAETTSEAESSAGEMKEAASGEAETEGPEGRRETEVLLEAPQVIVEPMEEQRMSEDGMVVLVQGSFDRVRIDGTGYEAVAESVAKWSEDAEELFLLSMEEYASRAAEDALLQGRDSFFFYSTGRTVELARVDDRVVSLRYFVSDYTGGAHGYTGCQGVVFDAENGNQLSLEDLAEDGQAFKEKALELCLKELQENKELRGLFADYEQSIRQTWADGSETGPVWYLDAAGITFVFNPYEIAPFASGIIYITIPYGEFAGEIKEEYLRVGQTGVAQVPKDEEIWLSAGEEQEEDASLRLFMGENADGNWSYLELGGKEDRLESFERLGSAYLIRKGDGKTYLLFDGDTASDDFVTFLYEIVDGAAVKTWQSDMWVSVKPGAVGAEHLKLNKVVDVLGTYSAVADYHIDDKGELVEDSEVYEINTGIWGLRELTVKKEVPVTIGGEKSVLGVGEKIRVVGTDNVGVVYVRNLKTGVEGEIEFTRGEGEDSWQVLIDGVQDTEYFENVPYAG